MPLLITPVISCRHSRSYIYSEFVEPELEPATSELVASLFRTVWPSGGLLIGRSGLQILAPAGELKTIKDSPAMKYIASELGFSLESLPQKLDRAFDIASLKVYIQAAPISLHDEICILPPVIRKSMSDLHVTRGRSDSIDEIMGRSPSVSLRDDGPFTIQTTTSHHVVICPRCKDICSVNDQRRIGQSDDRSFLNTFGHAGKSSCKSLQVSMVSFLEDNRESTKSESVQSFASSVSSSSEVSHRLRQSMSLNALPMTPIRRSSCPDVLSVQRSSVSSFDNFCEPISMTHKPTLSLLRTSHVFSQPLAPHNSIDSSTSKHSSESEKTKERIKRSLSRISQSAKTRKSTSRLSHRRDSGATVNFDHSIPESEISEDIQDLLSPISKRSDHDQENLGTLRISGSRPITNKSASRISSAPSPFVPSEVGKSLMNVFNHSVNPHDQQSQNLMWDTFVQCAKGSIEYADIRNKMPTVVYCLRGLLRFADPEFASRNRPDVLPYIFMLLLGRHSLVEEKSFIEAVECCCNIVGALAIDPLSRNSQNNLRPRHSFERVLLNQNCAILQQLVGALVQQLPRWISLESHQDPKLVLTTRAVQSILDILFIYIYRLREHWFSKAPQQFKDLLPKLMASIADKFPCHTERIVNILDVILDHANPNQCRQVGQVLKSAIQKSQPSESMNGTLNRWSAVSPCLPAPQSRSLSNLFGLIKTKSLKPSYTAKTIVIQEIKTGATL